MKVPLSMARISESHSSASDDLLLFNTVFMLDCSSLLIVLTGIWRKEIHRRTGNLPQQEFDKILKALESRKLVKQVSSVQVRTSFIVEITAC
jgi:hypothetical protein